SLRQKLESSLHLPPGVGKVALGADRQELGKGLVVDAQHRRSCVEVEEKELVETARDRTTFIEVAPQWVVEWRREECVEVFQIPVREPEVVGVGRRAVGQFSADEDDAIVEVQGILSGADGFT